MNPAGRLRLTGGLAIAGVGICVLGTLLPWLRSGERERSSYQLAGLGARLLGGPASTLAHAWLVFPLVAAGAIVALMFAPGRLTIAVAAVVTSTAALFAILVARVPIPGLVGLWITCLGTLIVLGGSVDVLILGTRRADTSNDDTDTDTDTDTDPGPVGTIFLEQH
jgi:hypothetical protein